MAANLNMDISNSTQALARQLASNSSPNGDAVSLSVMRKALDVQAQQANALIESVASAAPRPSEGPGQVIDTFA